MKKIILSLLVMVICMISYGQSDYKKLPSLGIHFILNDFRTAADIRSMGLAAVIRDKEWSRTRRMSAGLAISYIEGLTKHLDFVGSLAGSFVEYPVPNKLTTGAQKLLLEASATANLKLLSDRYYINPFITLGVGAAKFKGYFSAFMPAGIGLQFKVADNVFLLFNSQYRIPVTELGAYHFYHSFGVVAPLRKPAPAAAAVVIIPEPVILDRDNDGVLDADDKCPDVPGLAALQGCPDRDGDGIADADDKCPDAAGLAKYDGCPIPDTDGDGINDEMDKCPTVKGFARYQGCPIPDSDNDGVNDEEDRCPSRPGPVSNMGCPVISKEVVEKINVAAKNIFFATGSYKLLPKSFKSLNEVAALMKDDESLMLDVDGHTDSQGTNESNITLSDNRAAAVRDYLIQQGIDAGRLKATGYGEEKPIADNNTAAGRAKNRRTEMMVRNY